MKYNAISNTDLENLNKLNLVKIEEFKEKLNASLTAIFNAGQDYDIKPDHPSKEQRRLALRDGIAYGNLWLLTDILKNPDNPDPKNRKRQEDFYKEILNYLPQDNILTWSKRHATKILHTPLANCRDIMVYQDIKWDTTSINPYLYYKQSVTNVGNKIISLSFYNQIYTVLRSDPQNTLYWDLRANNSHFITLHQNETKNINDSIKWVSSGELMPRFVGFGDQGSLYYCSSITDNIMAVQENHVYPFEGKNMPEDILLDEIISMRSDFIKFISSVGRIYEQGDYNDVYFISKILIPSADETSIHYDRQNDLYDFQVDYYYNSIMEAKTNVRHTISNLEKTGKRVNKVVGSNEQENVWTIYDENMQTKGEINLTQLTKNIYSVDLKISGIKKS